MLTLTENASAVVNQIVSQEGLGESAGLRITADEATQSNLQVSATQQAEPGDQVVEQAGASVYLDENAAVMLEDKVLDAHVDESGQVGFTLAQQA